jgi:hypothetical protein
MVYFDVNVMVLVVSIQSLIYMILSIVEENDLVGRFH